MNNFSINLDKYLTNPPLDDLENYIEQVYENYSECFYNDLGSFEDSEKENELLSKLYEKDVNPSKAAEIIERFYYLYIKENEISKYELDRDKPDYDKIYF